MSENADVNLIGRVDAGKMRAKAQNNVNLLTASGQANHRFGTLSIECRRMEGQNAKNLLEGNGVFRSMEVRDMLDLAVTDEKLVLGSLSRNCSLSLKFKSIDIVGRVSTSKSFHAQALDGDLNLNDASLSAGGDVGLMSNRGSINVKHSDVAGNSIHMKAARDINIHAAKHSGSRAKASNIRAGKGNAYGSEGRTKGLFALIECLNIQRTSI
ncbi:unnamed protein product, partial [Mesorhabditis belari]|uniref:Uncharacterized protein n=1 Tax=Mesorhabditis belari TaxID=2138241 RepID=A0AAF3FIY3_9BILA